MKLASCLNKLKGMFTDAERTDLLEAGKGGDGVAIVEAELAAAKSDLDRVLSEISKAQATKSPAKEKEVAPEPKRPEGAVAPSALTHAPAVDIHAKADLTSASMAPTNVTAKLLAEPSMTVRDRFGGRQVPKHLVPVYSKAIGAAIKLGMPEHALDGIKHFYVKRKDLGAEYSIEAESIGVSLDILEAAYRGSQIWAATIVGHVIHEVGHHITGDADGTSFVAQSPDFAVRIGQDGKRVAVGVVMREALAARQSDSDLATFLGYPLRDWDYNDNARPVQGAGFSVAESTMILQEEVFAQAWSLYFTNPDLLQAEMPATFNVMKGVADVVRNSQGIAESRRGVREALRRRVPEVRTEVGRGDRLAVEAGARDGRPDSGMGSGRGDVASRKEARGEPDRGKPAADVRPAREGADERGAAEGVREDRQRRGSDEVAPEDLRGDGRGFTTFFTDATTGGRKPNTGKRFEPVIDISRTDAFSREYEKHRGNFDDHIATSIPGFRETQQAVGNAIAKSLPNGGTVLDIGASEGSFIKAITALSGGKIKTVGLDPNVAMAKFFLEHSSVPGSTYEMAAFGARADEGAHVWDEPDGTPVHFFKPKAKFDIVHEAMTFQFISNAREGQVARVKELMKAGGVALFEQKFIPGHDEFARNEAKKDSYKALYYSAAELDRKKKDVLERGEAAVAKEEKDKEEKVVGMHDLMVSPKKFEKILGDNFAHVVQYWDSGNFKGYAASDNPLALSRLVSNIGDLNSEYSTVETPSTVKGPARPKTLGAKSPVTDTPEFKSWFGESVVREPRTSTRDPVRWEDKKPLVVYHGTDKDFTSFEANRKSTNSGTFGPWETSRAGIFFAEDPRIAQGFAEQGERKRAGGANVIPVYLSIKNPVDIRNGFDDETLDAMESAGISRRFLMRVIPSEAWELFDEENDGAATVAAMKRAGFDGALITEIDPGTDEPFDTWVAFDPEQIKSAIGNNGNFDPKRPSILEIKDDAVPERSFNIGAQRGERDLGAARLTKEDFGKIVADGKALNLPQKRVQEFLAEARKTRSRFPPSKGWAPLELLGIRRVDRPTNDGTMAQDVELSWKPIAYGFNVPPGAKRAPAKIDRAWVDKVADKGVGEILSLYERAKTGDPVAKNIVAHASWYRAMASRLREEFGAAGDFFADLLGAFSPNTPVTTNWNFAVDALRAFSRGEYRQQLETFDNWIQAGNSPSKFPESDKIRQLSGKLFGINSTNGALAMLEMWRNIAPGMAPKARNFSANLIGASNEATIDVWAARFLRRMAGTIRGYSAPRIPVVAENAVTGNWNAGTTRVTGEFGFGQDVMAEMSKRLAKRGIDLTPPDLQAVAWFVEKELWTKNAWTSKQGEGGSFEAEADKWQLRRYFSGLSIQRDAAPEDMAMNIAAARLLSTTNADHRVVAHRALPTLGMYYGSEERSFDDEVVAREGWDPGYWIGEVAAIAKEHKQQDAMVTRVVGENDASTNARPGIEVFFKGPISKAQLESIHKAITEGGEAGFTLTIDPRAARTNAGETPDAFNGLRILYVPEFGLRFGDEGIIAAVRAGTDEAISSIMEEKANALADLANALTKRADVAAVRYGDYDSIVFGKENYDEYTRAGASQEAPGGGGEKAWFGQPLREVLARAARRYGILEGQDGGADVLQRTADGNEQEEVARRPGKLDVEQGVVERLDEPLWYSRLREAVQKAPWSKANDMPVGQLRMWVNARAKDGTLPAEELKWSGVDEWIDALIEGDIKRVSRNEVVDFIQENGVFVDELGLGEAQPPTGWSLSSRGDTNRWNFSNGIVNGYGDSAQEAIIDAKMKLEREANRWKKNGDAEKAQRFFAQADEFDAYMEARAGMSPGGEATTKFSGYQLPGGKNYRELLLTLPQDMSGFDATQTSDGKWRAISPGGSAYFGDTREQALERAGVNVNAAKFRSSHYDQPNILAHVRFNERTDADGNKVLFIEEIQSDWAQKGRKDGFNDAKLGSSDNPMRLRGNQPVPSAPFVGKTEAGVALALKRMIRYAADNGFDAVAWTNGEQQVDRYDLSKHIDRLVLRDGEGGGVHVRAYKGDNNRVINREVQEEELADTIGKELAAKYLKDRENADPNHRPVEYKGLNLKVGGEGMRAFYDKIVRNVANDLLKKMGGGRVGMIELGRNDALDPYEDPHARISDDGMTDLGGLLQPGFYLTDDIKPKARRPQALFAKTEFADVTQTTEFKAWFGNSKVVDEGGKPLVVYHGTTGDFSAFDQSERRDLGFHFGGRMAASFHAKKRKGAARVMPVFLSIENPVRLEDSFDSQLTAVQDTVWQLGRKHIGSDEVRAAITDYTRTNGSSPKAAWDMVQTLLEREGYDGVVYDNTGRGEGEDSAESWIAFRPEQIKSAIGNSGEFSAKRASILEVRSSLADRATEYVGDLFQTQKSFNLWDRTVGTAFHKAWKDADFKPVYDGVQNYLNDASRMMTEAADLAPDVLPKLEGLRGILGATASKADIESMSSAIFDGTLDDRVYTNTELAQRGLSPKAIDLYRQTRAAIDKSLTDLFTSEAVKQARDLLPPGVLAQARAAGDPWLIVDGLSAIPVAQRTPAQQQVYDQLRERLFKIEDLKRQGYAPLMRFGQYTVHLVDQNGGSLSFTMHESEREANAVARAMREAYPQATVSQGVLSQDAWQLFQGVTPDTLEIFAQSLGASDKEIFQKYLHLATNNRSTLKRLIRRKKIPGFSPDAQRALAQFVTSNGRAASRNYHWGDVLKAASAIPKAKGDVKDEAVRLAQYVQHPTEEAGALRGLLFVQFLGGSVASALTNATQPILMSFPYLSRFGAGKAASELVRAAKVAVGGTAPEIDLRDAMNKATHEGIIAPHEVAGLYAESIRNMGSNLVVRRILRAWGSLFSLAEAFNRRITFVAAFRLARDAGEADPYGFAVNAIAETQGVYNRGNRPNWARGPVGATLMTFKQYSVAYVEFLARLPAKQRAIALATLVLAAGLQGLPGADDLEDVVDTIAESLGYSFNSKKAAREWAIRTLGESAGGVLAGGFSGLPGVPIDVQARLGLGNLIPGTGVFKRSSPDKSRDVLEFFGPAGSQARSVVDAVSAAQEGNPGAVAKSMLPLAIQNALKAVDMASTGFYHDTRGRRVIDVDAYDTAIKGIGIQPKRVADVQRRRMDLQQDISLQRDVESEIADLWARGVYERDPEKVARARAKLLDWNLSNPESRVVITPQQIHKRVQQATMTADQRFLKTSPPELRARVASELLQ